ncbi:hypothetical protein C5O80_22860 [Burkholderia sp. SRS-46]|nr:hypothetical protein C5O80_22860 [Burkholderia sp. SRS-46]
MNSDVKHNNGMTGVPMAVDHLADARGLSMFPARYRSDMIERERADARAAIDNAMLSVGQVLEAALQAMTNLRAASAALAQSSDCAADYQDAGGAGKSS